MNIDNFEPVNAFIGDAIIDGVNVLKAIKDPAIKEGDAPTYAKLKGLEFHNGVITVQVLSRLLPDVPEAARGFIRKSGLIPRGLSRLKIVPIWKNLVLNQTV